MRWSMIRAIAVLEAGRMPPLLAVSLLLALAGVVLMAMPIEELPSIGYMLLFYLPVVFALILGADLAARDTEQKTSVAVAALPVSPLSVFFIRTITRLLFAFVFWGIMIALVHAGLRNMMPDTVSELAGMFHRRLDESAIGAHLELLLLFGFFAGAISSLFARDTLSAIGLGAAIFIAGSFVGSGTGPASDADIVAGIILFTAVLAAGSALIYAGRRPWTLHGQSRILAIGLGIIALIVLVL